MRKSRSDASLAGEYPRSLAGALGAAWVALWLGASAALASPPLRLASDTDVATAGFYRLEWQGDGAGAAATGDRFELQECTRADCADAVPLYRGPDLATVISGRRDGTRYYRVRAVPDDGDRAGWSNVVEVTTAHHPLSRALAFFTAGALVFALTLGLILRGSRHE
jgi:hypothetical protein